MLKICIYIGINAHVTPADAHTDGNVKVEQYSAEAESAIHSSVQFQECSLCLFSLSKIILHQQVGNGDQGTSGSQI